MPGIDYEKINSAVKVVNYKALLKNKHESQIKSCLLKNILQGHLLQSITKIYDSLEQGKELSLDPVFKEGLKTLQKDLEGLTNIPNKKREPIQQTVDHLIEQTLLIEALEDWFVNQAENKLDTSSSSFHSAGLRQAKDFLQKGLKKLLDHAEIKYTDGQISEHLSRAQRKYYSGALLKDTAKLTGTVALPAVAYMIFAAMFSPLNQEEFKEEIIKATGTLRENTRKSKDKPEEENIKKKDQEFPHLFNKKNNANRDVNPDFKDDHNIPEPNMGSSGSPGKFNQGHTLIETAKTDLGKFHIEDSYYFDGLERIRAFHEQKRPLVQELDDSHIAEKNKGEYKFLTGDFYKGQIVKLPYENADRIHSLKIEPPCQFTVKANKVLFLDNVDDCTISYKTYQSNSTVPFSGSAKEPYQPSVYTTRMDELRANLDKGEDPHEALKKYFQDSVYVTSSQFNNLLKQTGLPMPYVMSFVDLGDCDTLFADHVAWLLQDLNCGVHTGYSDTNPADANLSDGEGHAVFSLHKNGKNQIIDGTTFAQKSYVNLVFRPEDLKCLEEKVDEIKIQTEKEDIQKKLLELSKLTKTILNDSYYDKFKRKPIENNSHDGKPKLPMSSFAGLYIILGLMSAAVYSIKHQEKKNTTDLKFYADLLKDAVLKEEVSAPNLKYSFENSEFEKLYQDNIKSLNAEQKTLLKIIDSFISNYEVIYFSKKKLKEEIVNLIQDANLDYEKVLDMFYRHWNHNNKEADSNILEHVEKVFRRTFSSLVNSKEFTSNTVDKNVADLDKEELWKAIESSLKSVDKDPFAEDEFKEYIETNTATRFSDIHWPATLMNQMNGHNKIVTKTYEGHIAKNNSKEPKLSLCFTIDLLNLSNSFLHDIIRALKDMQRGRPNVNVRSIELFAYGKSKVKLDTTIIRELLKKQSDRGIKELVEFILKQVEEYQPKISTKYHGIKSALRKQSSKAYQEVVSETEEGKYPNSSYWKEGISYMHLKLAHSPKEFTNLLQKSISPEEYITKLKERYSKAQKHISETAGRKGIVISSGIFTPPLAQMTEDPPSDWMGIDDWMIDKVRNKERTRIRMT